MEAKIITKQIKLIGHTVRGRVVIECWGGGMGEIQMDQNFIPIGKPITKTVILNCINDGQFGCQRIVEANINIQERFSDGTSNLVKEMTVEGRPEYQKHFCKGI